MEIKEVEIVRLTNRFVFLVINGRIRQKGRWTKYDKYYEDFESARKGIRGYWENKAAAAERKASSFRQTAQSQIVVRRLGGEVQVLPPVLPV